MVHSEKGIIVKTDVGFLDCPSVDIVVVTGGPGQSDMMNHSGLMTFISVPVSVLTQYSRGTGLMRSLYGLWFFEFWGSGQVSWRPAPQFER